VSRCLVALEEKSGSFEIAHGIPNRSSTRGGPIDAGGQDVGKSGLKIKTGSKEQDCFAAVVEKGCA